MEELIGKQLGGFQIVSPLGKGGMASVYKAYQPRMDRYVALKILHRHFTENPEFVSRFTLEARVIARLEHPHILPVHDFGESNGYTYLAMRLLEGGSLSDLLKDKGKLPGLPPPQDSLGFGFLLFLPFASGVQGRIPCRLQRFVIKKATHKCFKQLKM